MKSNIDYHKLVLENQTESYQTRFKEEKKYLQEKIKPNQSVLEIWCGDWRSIFDLLPITQNITWIDHNDKAVNEAKNNFWQIPSIKIIKAFAEKLPFEDKSFDCIICMTTFANFGNKKHIIINEMKRVLKDKWKIIISVFSENALEDRLKVYKKIWLEIKEIIWWKVVFDKSVWANTSEQFSKEELENIFSEANLKTEDIKKVNIAYLCTFTK
jgi:ubiquinone/menaquinone biosynthesis C-methylase UbiE